MDDIATKLALIEMRLGNIEAYQASLIASATPKATTVDAGDLDSERGNYRVKYSPPMWLKRGGERFDGKLLSELTAEECDAQASYCDYLAKKADSEGAVDDKGRPRGDWKRLDAARARGWSARHRAGWKAPAEQPFRPISAKAQVQAPFDDGGDDSLPF